MGGYIHRPYSVDPVKQSQLCTATAARRSGHDKGHRLNLDNDTDHAPYHCGGFPHKGVDVIIGSYADEIKHWHQKDGS
jgi:hypothetical protein